MHEHEELAELSVKLFLGLTIAFLLLAAGPKTIGFPRNPGTFAFVHALFFGVYMGACLVLINTGHQGGRLVHELRVELKDKFKSPAMLAAEAEKNEAKAETSPTDLGTGTADKMPTAPKKN